MMEAPHLVRIGVAPYDDGSGYRATVFADDEDGKPTFRVVIYGKLDASAWPELRDAVERAIALVTPPLNHEPRG